MSKPRKKELIDRLADAITYHRKNPPKVCDRKYVRALALRYGVNWKNVEAAINMMAQGVLES